MGGGMGVARSVCRICYFCLLLLISLFCLIHIIFPPHLKKTFLCVRIVFPYVWGFQKGQRHRVLFPLLNASIELVPWCRINVRTSIRPAMQQMVGARLQEWARSIED